MEPCTTYQNTHHQSTVVIGSQRGKTCWPFMFKLMSNIKIFYTQEMFSEETGSIINIITPLTLLFLGHTELRLSSNIDSVICPFHSKNTYEIWLEICTGFAAVSNETATTKLWPLVIATVAI